MKIRLVLAALAGLSVACAKGSDPKTAKSTVPDGWAVYEDDMFRVSYPPGSEVHGAKDGKQDPASPSLAILPPPNAGKTMTGAFVLLPDPDSKGMLLRDGIEAELKRKKGDRDVLLSAPREFPVINGRCLGTILISPTSNCEKGAGTCYAPSYSMLCDGAGARYTSLTVLSSSPSRDKLSPQAQQEAAVYERILRSLEFKKS